jgi:hypothetical protein
MECGTYRCTMQLYAFGKNRSETNSQDMYKIVHDPVTQLNGSPYAPSQDVTYKAPMRAMTSFNPLTVATMVTIAKIYPPVSVPLQPRRNGKSYQLAHFYYPSPTRHENHVGPPRAHPHPPHLMSDEESDDLVAEGPLDLLAGFGP